MSVVGLVDTLDQLTRGAIDVGTALKRAYALTAGTGGVLQPANVVERELAALKAEIDGASFKQERKWAAAMLLVEAMVGNRILNPAISFVMDFARSARGPCPAKARPYASAMIQSIVRRMPAEAKTTAESLRTVEQLLLGRTVGPSTGDAPRLTLWRAIGDLGWFYGLFSAIVGAPSILALLQMVFVEHTLEPALQWIVDGYSRIVGILAAYLEPLLRPILDWINAELNWTLALQPHWTALFVLSWIALAADVRSNVHAGVNARAATYGIIETICTALGVLAAGLMPLVGPWWAQAIMAAAPYVFLRLGYALCMVVKSAVTREGKPHIAFLAALRQHILGSAAVFVGAAVLSIVLSRGAGIIVFGVAILLTGFNAFRGGLRLGDRSAARYGITTMGGFLVAGLVIAADAVLKEL